MSATQICSLKPNVPERDALRAFSSFGFGRLYWTLRSGPLQRIALVYVPFSLYRVGYRMNRSNITRWFALDVVDGSLDLFQFPCVPSGMDLHSLVTRNRLSTRLESTIAETRLREKVLRLIFQQGFFKLRDLRLDLNREPLEFHIPYWIGFHGSSGNSNGNEAESLVRCRVLDAVRRKFEGAKASAFFEHWLAQ